MSVNDSTDQTDQSGDPNRRDFLYVATGAVGAVGAAALAWPFIDQMNPDAAALALAEIDVDVSQIAEGQSVTAMWRGKPVFIRQRTAQEIEEARAVDVDELKDPIARNENLTGQVPATDENRTAPDREAWLVMIGVCTHLGCIPLGQSGPFDGWFCPCHGSAYDTAGRIRSGPAPTNMTIPPFTFTSDSNVRIG